MTCTFNNGILETVTHKGTSTVAKLPRGMHVTSDFTFSNFWCIQDAFAQLKPMKPIKLITLFEKHTEPNTFGHHTGGGSHAQKRALLALAKKVHQEWMDEVNKLKESGDGQTGTKAAIKSALAEQKKESTAKKMQDVQKRASEALQQKAAKRRLAL